MGQRDSSTDKACAVHAREMASNLDTACKKHSLSTDPEYLLYPKTSRYDPLQKNK